ncbi:hypothetical protein DDZ13_06295 [Coraliomargarita sinensis]|uniref:histidine kinase n=1 Tax=Coraliomargarita sinensis TaxID=2174842 RepID=A0A317ZGP2_9BACT|nr:ATP-binding protein [Coraliomargarita sinensis]PXA04775.1 hypothetical protein DDZ13_06295 [Coraliomargarita sinensis]
MSQILVICSEAKAPKTIREALATTDIRIVCKQSPQEAQTALERNVFEFALVYSNQENDLMARHLTQLQYASHQIRVIVISPEYSAEEEKIAFDSGADLYFAEPLPVRTLLRVLTRPTTQQVPDTTHTANTLPPQNGNTTSTASALQVLRDFSHVLGYSLDYKAFSRQFIMKLREHISFSRIAIFLEGSAKQPFLGRGVGQAFECIASLGIPGDLIDCFQLSRGVGIGQSLSEHPRIIRSNSPECLTNQDLMKEFAILGCQLAVPITDRERLIGLAVLNGPITDRPYSEDELQLLFLLMEELGLAIRNSRLHMELASHGRMIENVLCAIHSGAIVIDEELNILYANEAARRFLEVESKTSRQIDFAELPAKLAAVVHRAVEKGDICEPFFIPGSKENEIFRVSLFPFTTEGELTLLPRPTMVLLDDFTKIEANKQTALEDSRDELISLIAERFAHEIRNSLVPLTTHAQLIEQRIDDPKFQKSLKQSLLKETSRIKRFSEQMLYLAQDATSGNADIEIKDVLLSAFNNAKEHLGFKDAKLEMTNSQDEAIIHGNPEALCYAFEELFLNGLQSSPESRTIHLELQENAEGIIHLLLRDEGKGFTEESLDSGLEPFFTTRNTGVGLGLSVAHKVVTDHGGFLQLKPRNPDNIWDIDIRLPALIETAST